MFTNPLNRKYQTGGPTPTDDERKDMEGFITWIKSNVEGFKDKSTKEIAQSISDMAKSEEGKKSVQSLYSKYQKSKKQKSKFADGGKMQSFICKHAHGGNVDCGCGGTVVRAAKGEQLPDGNIFSGWTRNVRRWINLPDGSTQSVETIVSPDGQTGYERIITDRSRMQNRNRMAVRDTSYNGGAYIDGNLYIDASQDLTPQEKADLNAYLDSKPQSKQEGGPVLTRRQARELSGLNRGYNRSNFQTAMANADLVLRNTGLRGKELRQAKRRMVAGINVLPVQSEVLVDDSTPTIVTEPIQEAAAITELPKREKPIVSYDSMKFNDAFAAANKAGLDVFTWRGKPYKVEFDPNWKTRWGKTNSAEIVPDQTIVLTENVVPVSTEAVTSSEPPVVNELPTRPYWKPGDGRATLEETIAERERQLGRKLFRDERRMIEAVYNTPDGIPEGYLPNGALNNQFGRSAYGGHQHQLWSGFFVGPTLNKLPLQKCGGQIEKHQQDDGIIGHYRNKWSNDWNNIKRGWNNFKDSAIGLVVPTSGIDVALMTAGPMFKIAGKAAKASDAIEKVGDVGRKVLTKTGKSVTIIPEGVYGSEKAAKRALTESAPFISQKGELVNEAARNINGLRKWLYGGWYNATTNLPK